MTMSKPAASKDGPTMRFVALMNAHPYRGLMNSLWEAKAVDDFDKRRDEQDALTKNESDDEPRPLP